jgi:hypothetical protein
MVTGTKKWAPKKAPRKNVMAKIPLHFFLVAFLFSVFGYCSNQVDTSGEC